MFRNIRFYVLAASFLLSAALFLYIDRTTRLTQIYALAAVTYLYFALLAGPLCYTFKFLPFRGHYLKARRAIGVSAFYFGLLHACLAFFGQLGGFKGLGFLPGKYLLAISFGFTTLVILSLMAATSFDYLIRKLTYPKWKMLHRFVYLAGILVIIHALMLGTHFSNLSENIPRLFLVALSFLGMLEANRFDAFLQKFFPRLPRFGFTFVLVWGLIIAAVIYVFYPSRFAPSLGIHSQHIQIAKETQKELSATPGSTISALQGDRSKRFTVSFLHSQNLNPNRDTKLTFQIFDASNGNKVVLFSRVYDKTLHLIIVDNELKYFSHIHPNQSGQDFEILTSFPHTGTYHLYLDFQPLGAIEQQFAFTIKIGDSKNESLADFKPDTQLTKIFGNHEVTLTKPEPFSASQISTGQQRIKITLKDVKTQQPITTLQPYLAAFGHLVMINQKTYDYVHVHPTNLTAPKEGENGGPVVEFMPLGLYGPIKPGIYRVFAQFNPDGKLLLADYVIEITP